MGEVFLFGDTSPSDPGPLRGRRGWSLPQAGEGLSPMPSVGAIPHRAASRTPPPPRKRRGGPPPRRRGGDGAPALAPVSSPWNRDAARCAAAWRRGSKPHHQPARRPSFRHPTASCAFAAQTGKKPVA